MDQSEKRPPKGDRISHDEQLARWVRGESVHRQFTIDLVDERGAVVGQEETDECTPDFSCCHPPLQAAPEVRQAFAAAGEKERLKFLGSFLGAAFTQAAEEAGVKAPELHIAGAESPS